MGDASVFVKEDTGRVCRAQASHRVLSDGVGGERFREGACQIRDGSRVDPVSDGESAAAGADQQDYGLSGSRERRGRQEVEDVTRGNLRASGVHQTGRSNAFGKRAQILQPLILQRVRIVLRP